MQIFGNSALVTQLGLPDFGDVPYWTSEEDKGDNANAYLYNTELSQIESDIKTATYYALPVRVVNFYELPLIGSEYGGGLVYDVVAETDTVHVVIDVETYGGFDIATWNNAILNAESEINGIDDWTLPTRAQATKIFGNVSLVALAGLPTDENYWTGEEDEGDSSNAYAYDTTLGQIDSYGKTELCYALPVRSEVFGT